jgi:hypothetical protein
MKRILTLILMLVAFSSFAQIGVVRTVLIDTLDNTNAKNSDVITVSGSYRSIAIQALCTQLGGTSDGTLVLKGSVDGTSYQTISSSGGFAKFYTADTHTITNGSVWLAVLQNAPFKYYRVTGTGTANDTTYVTLKYVLK